ncbi:MAG: NAD-dependent epimerase/dehydratase family protein [Candidatus Aenigmarchaeota archaeon]|nr:NAD-dependent epimerase/dehydratase family protein [Candidatus Aenigmarchaeota archaeon]
MSDRVLITGATGFVGACLSRELISHGDEVHVMTRKTSNLWRIKDIFPDLNVHTGDILDITSLESAVKSDKPDVIYHMATYGGYHFQKDRENIIKTNLTGILNLLKVCPKSLDMFVNTGSSSEYGIKNHPIKETDSLEPVSFYASSKAAATLLCQTWSKEEDVPLVTFRPFSIYGYFEGSTRLIPQTIFSCMAKKRPVVNTPKAVRDFIFVEDVTRAYRTAAKKLGKSRGEIINLGSGRQHNVLDVTNKIIRISGSALKPLIKKEKRWDHEPSCWVADTSKAKKMLGWRTENTIEEGLKKTVKWFKKNMDFYKE